MVEHKRLKAAGKL